MLKKLIAVVLAGALLIPSTLVSLAAPADDGLLVSYAFAEAGEAGDGVPVENLTGNTAYNGEMKGAVTKSEGLFGAAAELSGNGAYIAMPGSALTATDDVSISTWINLKQRKNWQAVMASGTSQSNYVVFAAEGNPNGQNVGLTYAIKTSGKSEERIKATTANRVPAGEWCHVVFTQTGTDAKLYLNGTEVAAGTLNQKLRDLGESATTRIGGNHIWPDPYLEGKMDEFKMYNRVLSAQEVKAETDRGTLHKALSGISFKTDVVFDAITLPTEFAGVQIGWTSSNPSVISDAGVVVRPTDADAQVTLTATASVNDSSLSKEFRFTVPMLNTDNDLALAKDALVLPKGTRTDLVLPASGLFESTVVWSSENPLLISDAGVITRPARGMGNAQTTLTATISKGGKSVSKAFAVNVIGLDELVNHYAFDGDTTDSISGMDGIARGETGFAGGILGQSVDLDGKTGYIEMPKGWVKDAEELTISTWVKLDQARAWQMLFHISQDTKTYLSLGAQGSPSGKPTGVIWSGAVNGAAEQRAESAPENAVRADEWSHVAATFKNGEAVVYLDGVEVARNSGITYSIKDFGDTVNNYIGGCVFSPPDPKLDGKIDEYKIYYRAVDPSELQKEVQANALLIAKDALELGDLSNVTENVKLPTTGMKGTTITWTSSDQNFITNDGVVTIPTPAQGDQTVTLTAMISKDGVSGLNEQKTFTVTLLAMTDERILAKDADYIQRVIDYMINDGSALPTAGKSGSAVAWELVSGDAQITGQNTVIKTETSAEREPIVLKATVSKGEESKTLTFENVTLIDKFTGYVLSHFGGTEHKESLCLGYSYDGVNWITLNEGKPVIQNTLGNGRIRDPFLMRNKDGSFTVIATQGWDTPQIYLWQSDNLTEYTNERLLTVSKPGVAGLTGSRAWAPEGSYDPIKDEYLVYWSDPAANGGSGPIYYNTSKDLGSFSDPAVFFDAGYSIIDASIIKHDGEYFLVYKDEREPYEQYKAIKAAKSTSLEAGSFEVYTDDYITERPVEGPFVFKDNNENKWYHYYDYFFEQKFGYSVTTDLASGEWEFMGKNKNMPTEDVRHGGVAPVTQKELDAIIAKWGAGALNVLSIPESAQVAVANGTAFETLNLPATVDVVLSDGGKRSCAVVWSSEGYDASINGVYTLTGTITAPENVSNSDNLTASIKVEVKDEVLPELSAILSDMGSISGAVGTEMTTTLGLTALPADGEYRSLEAVVTLPSDVEITSITSPAQSEKIRFDFERSGDTLRFAFISMDKTPFAFTAEQLAKLVKLDLRLTAEKAEGDILNVAFDRLTVKTGDSTLDKTYDVSKAASQAIVIAPAEEKTATSRELYKGDGIDLIPAGKRAVAVEFTGVAVTDGVKIGETIFYYSPEKTELTKKTTFVALVDEALTQAQLDTIENYTFTENAAASLLFGDTNDKDGVNAQDALNVLYTWLRKSESPDDRMILVMNVTADSRIDTGDSVAIVDSYVGLKDLPILEK